MKALLFLATPFALAGVANAQLVLGNSPAQENFHHCVASNTATPMWAGLPTVVGMAADDANQILYVSETFNIYSTPYNGGNPTFVAAPTDTVTGGAIRCEALAYGDPFGTGPQLYAIHEFASTAPAAEGIYEIDLNTGLGTPIYLFPDTTIDIGGLDYNPTDGLFYGSNDGSGYPGGRGIVAFDVVNQTEALVAPYNGNTDVDGIAVDPAGWVYLVEDQPSLLHRWDLNNNAYDANPQQSPITLTTTFSGASWAPSWDTSCVGSLGTNFECTATVPNSSGGPAVITAMGSDVVGDNDVTLSTTGMPTNQFGYYVNSMNQNPAGFVPPGSQGNLCVGPAGIGRYNLNVFNTGATGEGSLVLDLTQTPTPTGPVAIAAGETWYWTTWFRDNNPGATSNFSDAVCITFQ